MQQVPHTDIFELRLNADAGQFAARPLPPRLVGKEPTERHSAISPYSFEPLLSDLDLHLFSEGRHHHIYRLLGAHCMEVDGISGCRFAVWAPASNAPAWSVISMAGTGSGTPCATAVLPVSGSFSYRA